jgi:prepilin-type N-terminal cleavage/methylation domain-containing protein
MVKRINSNYGFTLVEMMVVLALLTTLTTLAFGAIRFYGGTVNAFYEKAHRFEQARFFAALREAFHGAYLWLEPATAKWPKEAGGYHPYFDGEAQQVSFYTIVPLYHRPDGQPYQVDIHIVDGIARLRERPAYDRQRGYGATLPWSEAYYSLPAEWTVQRIEYLDKNHWVGQLEGRMPAAIRLSVLTAKGPEQWFFALRTNDNRRLIEAVYSDAEAG